MTAEPKKHPARNEPAALVAGGAGFIGSHLCEALLAQGFRVYCLDNLSSGSKENIKELLTKQNFHFVETDITNNIEVLNSFENLEVVFHLAALEAAPNNDFSLETLLVNSIGSRNLLELAKKQGARFILVSSGDIYQGSFSSSSFKYFFGQASEEATMTQHEAKRFAEALTVEYFKKYKLNAAIVRVKDVYGPRMNLKQENDLVSLIRASKEKDKLVVGGDGLSTLNPTYISDVVFGLIKVAQGDYSGEIFNLISNEKATVAGLAETLRLVVGNLEIVHEGSEAKLEFPPPPLELETTRQRLKWANRVTLAEGLSSTLQSFSQNLPAKMVTLTPEPEVSEAREAKRSSQPRTKNYLRIAIFTLSLLLIVFTTAAPFLLFIFEARGATDKLGSAYADLELDKADMTVNKSEQALRANQKAQKNLNNVRWLFQLAGQRGSLRADEQLLFGAENTIIGVRLLSQVVKAITAADGETDKAKATSYLREANQYLGEANQNLDLAKANLAATNEKSLTPFLSGSETKLKEINEAAVAAATSIGSSLEATLGKIEARSTAP